MSADLAKLRKSILMLSSQHDGEIVSAARAINRLLASSGLDWHWLASRIITPQEAPGPTHERQEGAFAANPNSAADWLLANHATRLRPRDRDFLETMREWRGQPTERQAVWLNDLCRRFGYRS